MDICPGTDFVIDRALIEYFMLNYTYNLHLKGTHMRILLIEDDHKLCNNIRVALEQEKYHADVCFTGNDGLLYASTQAYDVIILDRMLSDFDGLSLLQLLRKKGVQTPIIMETALDGITDRIDGLDSGADDYIVKPFNIHELMARIRAIVRRPGRIDLSPFLEAYGMKLEECKHELTYLEQTLLLSKKETELLSLFMRNTKQTLPRTLILSYVWGSESEVDEGNLENYIYFIRRRLKALNAPTQIKTIHGVGYRMEAM